MNAPVVHQVLFIQCIWSVCVIPCISVTCSPSVFQHDSVVFVPLQESSGPAPNTILPAYIWDSSGQNIQSELQTSCSDHGWPGNSVWTELAERPGTIHHTDEHQHGPMLDQEIRDEASLTLSSSFVCDLFRSWTCTVTWSWTLYQRRWVNKREKQPAYWRVIPLIT